MTERKQRITVTVDRELIEAGKREVEFGRADSVSGWVSAALEEKVARDAKLAIMAAAVADYEREFGEITPEEIHAQQRADRENAIVVRSGRPVKRKAASA